MRPICVVAASAPRSRIDGLRSLRCSAAPSIWTTRSPNPSTPPAGALLRRQQIRLSVPIRAVFVDGRWPRRSHLAAQDADTCVSGPGACRHPSTMRSSSRHPFLRIVARTSDLSVACRELLPARPPPSTRIPNERGGIKGAPIRRHLQSFPCRRLPALRVEDAEVSRPLPQLRLQAMAIELLRVGGV